MQKAFAKLLLIALFLGSVAFDAKAEDEPQQSPLTVDLNVALYSNYMFRGLDLYDGTSIQPSIQPHYSLGDYGNLSALVWMHLSAEQHTNVERFTEMDLAAIYDITFAPFTFSVGNYWYTYPDKDDDIPSTREAFASIAIDTMLSPTISYYRDYGEFDSNYYEIGLSHTFEATGENGYNLTPFVNFGFASSAEKVYADNGFVQSTMGVSTDLKFGDATITPMMAYTAESDANAVNQFWFGATWGYSF